jgi:RHS repeat-associated protein
MANQRIASALSHQADTTGFVPSAGYEEGNMSFSTDAIVVDIEASLDCLYDEDVDLDWEQMLAPVELGSFMYMDCATQLETTNASLLSSDTCACEQSTYWSAATGVNCSSLPIIYYYHPDYLGSVEFITDMRGDPYQFFFNTIWGENLQNQLAFNTTAFSSRFRFNGKEWDEETGNFYYGARYYDPKISVWLSVDPLAHEYPSWSPYVFTINDPINLVDPDGRKVAKASQKEWNNHKRRIKSELAHVNSLLAAAVLNLSKGKPTNANFAELFERSGRLQQTLKAMSKAENDLRNTFRIDTKLNDDGKVYYDISTGEIVIQTDGNTSNFVHEIEHVRQFYNHDIGFLKDGTGNAAALDLFDEVSAYKAQYAYDPASLMGISSSKNIMNFSDISANWVASIHSSITKQKMYTRHGLTQVNLFSPASDLDKAWPGKFTNKPNGYTLSQAPSSFLHMAK